MEYRKKVEDQVLIESYSRHKNVWKVGEEVSMSGQSVHERLSKLGVINKMKVLSSSERDLLLNEYVKYKSNGELSELAALMKRDKTYICMQAKKLGLTSRSSYRPYAEKEGANPYFKFHYRVRKLKGSPHKCEACGTDSLTEFYEWANLTGDFENPDDYKRMCRKCHRKHDKKDFRLYKKINAQIEKEIVDLLITGKTQQEIAVKYDIGKNLVSVIGLRNGLRRKTRKRYSSAPGTDVVLSDEPKF
jgi:hypothetical protein